jgi:hypothetical protein
MGKYDGEIDPPRMTVKWLMRQTDEHLRVLLKHWYYPTCRWHMIDQEIKRREQAMRPGETNTGGQVWKSAPYQSGPTHTGSIAGVWAFPDEEVEWIWTHTPGGSYVSGYTVKPSRLPNDKGDGHGG